MEKYLFIINPVAGVKKAMDYIPEIQREIDNRNVVGKIVVTKSVGEATDLVLLNSDYEVCVAVGGDGTVNEVAKGILQRKSGILGIIPSGTGNDLAKVLGIEENIEKSIINIFENESKNIDIGLAKDKYFFNIASLGFDAQVVRSTDLIRKFIKGKIAYVLGVVTSLIGYRKRMIKVIIDGVEIERNAMLVAVGNGQYYGGGMQILPMSIVDDGEFDICIVKDISNIRILFLFPSIFKGEHVKYKEYVEFYKGKEVLVNIGGKYYLNVDGEISPVKDESIDFKLSKNKLRVKIWFFKNIKFL